jgi:hypothetical protein
MFTQEQTLETLFSDMSGSSRIWIYQANRFLTENEKTLIITKASDFVKSWESHGSKLKADFTLLHNLFLIFSVDENQHEASGCSIDKSVHFVKEIQKETGINFFDRTIIAYYSSENNISLIPLSEIKKAVVSTSINSKALIFNNLIDSLEKIRTQWIVPAENSWLSKFF